MRWLGFLPGFVPGFVFAVSLLAAPLLARAAATDVDGAAQAWIDGEIDGVVALYRHLHANPELSLEERETAARVAQELEAAGYEVTTGVGGTGVVGVLENGDGPVVMIRGDMDALPVRCAPSAPTGARSG